MADATTYPDLVFFQWERDGAESPRLDAVISDSATELLVTNPPLNEDGLIVSKAFLMGIKNKKGYTETIYVPANAVQGYGNAPDSTNKGLTITGVTRGIDLAGIDYTTQNTSGNAVAHNDNEVVFCNISATIHAMLVAAFQGDIASGGTGWIMGRETAENILVKFARAAISGNLPYFGWDEGTSQLIYSNDGVSSTPFGTGAGVTGGDGITVTAGSIAVDITDVTIFRSVRSTNEIIGVLTEASDGQIDETFLRRVSPAGILSPYAGATAPSGWLLCDGTTGLDSTVDTSLADLYAVIGTTFGGTGANDFDLPDMRGNFPLGKDDMGGASRNRVTDTEADTIGDEAGAQTHTLTTAEIPAHSHPLQGNSANPGNQAFGAGNIFGSADSGGDNYMRTLAADTQNTAAIGNNTGGGGAHENMSPYMTFNYIIKK